MKRKVPHIILRFSKQVNPPVAPAASALSEFSSSAKFTPPAASFTTMTESSDSPPTDTMARQSSDNEGAGARSDKRKRNVQSRYKNVHGSDTAALPTPSPSAPTPPFISPASQLIRKRKRSVPKSIGGGKGDLQPPSKKPRRLTISKQPTILTTTKPQNETEKKDGDKRVTRSQDTQQKSELAEWFEDRNDEDDFVVDVDYLMKIVENDTTPRSTRSVSKTRVNGLTNGYIHNENVNVNGSGAAQPLEAATAALETPVTESQNLIPTTRDVIIKTIDLEAEARASSSRLIRFATDPLADDLYIRPHTSMGREEKRLRNVERDRAAHDKQRYEDRLDKLRGSDWIKTFNLGMITQKLGVAEMEKRKTGVIKWHESLLRKFKAWKEEERRRKLAAAGRTSRSLTNSQERELEEFEGLNGQTVYDEDEEDEEDEDEDDEEKAEEKDIYAITDDSDEGDHHHHPKQHRHTSKSSKSSHRLTVAGSPKKKQPEPKPFTSFYDNPHMRQAVLNTSRKSSRNLKPFGASLPELEEKEFGLPEEYFQKTARHLRARRRVSK